MLGLERAQVQALTSESMEQVGPARVLPQVRASAPVSVLGLERAQVRASAPVLAQAQARAQVSESVEQVGPAMRAIPSAPLRSLLPGRVDSRRWSASSRCR